MESRHNISLDYLYQYLNLLANMLVYTNLSKLSSTQQYHQHNDGVRDLYIVGLLLIFLQ
nr:MAG TPA: hypothetical protein [Caudoviricetes sp.]